MCDRLPVETLSSCPVCASRRFRFLPTPGHWIGREVFGPLEGKIRLAYCQDCSLCFVNPRPTLETLERFYQGDNYSCHQPAELGSDASARRDYLVKLLTPLVTPGRHPKLLDYGCGAGDFVITARKAGWDATGYEPGARGRQACLARGVPVVGRLQDLPQGDFDFITFNHVFEHLADHAAVLKVLQELVARTGFVYIEVPNVCSLRARLSFSLCSRRLGFDERYRAFPIHLTYFNESTLSRLLAQNGYRVEQILTIGLGLEELLLSRVASKSKEHSAMSNGDDGRKRSGFLRKTIKKAILGSQLGENLGVICRTGQPEIRPV